MKYCDECKHSKDGTNQCKYNDEIYEQNKETIDENNLLVGLQIGDNTVCLGYLFNNDNNEFIKDAESRYCGECEHYEGKEE